MPPDVQPNRLEALMLEVQRDPSKLDEFYQLLLTSKLWIIGVKEDLGESSAVDSLAVPQFRLYAEILCTPVFTSAIQLRNIHTQMPAAYEVDGTTIMNNPECSAIALNLGTELEMIIPRAEYAHLLTGPVKPTSSRQIEEVTCNELSLVQDLQAHTNLKTALSCLFLSCPEISRAWLMQSLQPRPRGEEELVLLLESDQDTTARLIEMGQLAVAHGIEARRFGMLPLSLLTPAARALIVDQAVPFYAQAPAASRGVGTAAGPRDALTT